ncbi:MAG: glutathione S-transferase family protein [Burkholderiaceae bacterium]
MLKFFFSQAPNPMKVVLLLEELGRPFEPIPIDTRKGQQFSSEFIALNPNAKVPVIVDGDVTVFDSNAILLYLAEQSGQFLPEPSNLVARGQLLSWLMFVASGIGPFSGQSVHFRHYAPSPNEYAMNRYDFEAHRHWKVIEDRLGRQEWLVDTGYSIADMALWGWARMVPFVLGLGDAAWAQYPQIKRWLDAINARPAAARAEAFRNSYKFKTEMDAESHRFMFPSNERLAQKG